MQKPLASQLGILIIYLSLYLSFVIQQESETCNCRRQAGLKLKCSSTKTNNSAWKLIKENRNKQHVCEFTHSSGSQIDESVLCIISDVLAAVKICTTAK